jgi:Contractile injection system tube protein
MPLKKATLREITGAAHPKLGPEIEVQFNPASLKLELANKVEGGDTRSQRRQYLGKTSTTLTFDLHFDTADEGTPTTPVSVRTRTAAVEAFVLPKGSGKAKQKPPKARFQWGELVIDGIIESLSIDFDLFAPNGTPLRAKMGIAIKEQDAKYQLLGPGANRAIDDSKTEVRGTGPGTTTTGPTDRSADALEGESAADFATRMGLDPTAWRGIAAQLGGGSPLSLPAGAPIDFSSSLSSGAGIGMSAGVEASAGASLGESFGLEASVSVSPGGPGSAAVSAGFALSAAGGVAAAIETVAIVAAESAASGARRSFGSAVPLAGTPGPAMPEQPRAPLQKRGTRGQPLPSAMAQAAAPPAPAPPVADARATSFGFGVPLRPRAGFAADLRSSAAAGRVPLRSRAAVDVLTGNDPSAPPWTQLPASVAQRSADRTQAQRHPARRCGCGGHCRHGARTCR